MSLRRRGHLRKIAVTGGIGSGKSTLVSELAAFGYPVFDADILVSKVVVQDHVVSLIKSLLGEGAYIRDANGLTVYQRGWVRDRVFGDSHLRSSLEDIIHPELAKMFADICSRLEEQAGGIWVFYEAALIFETGREKDFDAVVSVVATDELRKSRLMKSRKLSEETLSAIFSAQVGDDLRRTKSHFVVENSGELADLRSQTPKLLDSLRNFFHPQSG
ncbi:dephospho-CoA kinase [bacterium]|nr:dephospho-CoA kinase [bacterium]